MTHEESSVAYLYCDRTIFSSTVKSIVITSLAVFNDSQQGVLDETVWNEADPQAIESWQPGTEISPSIIYSAPKSLAEKGSPIYAFILP